MQGIHITLALLAVLAFPALSSSQSAQAAKPDSSAASSTQDKWPRVPPKILMSLNELPSRSPLDERLIGSKVALTDVCVVRVGPNGFWVTTKGARQPIYVVAAEGPLITVEPGRAVSVQGEVRAMDDTLRKTLSVNTPSELAYVYGYIIRPASPLQQVQTQRGVCGG